MALAAYGSDGAIPVLSAHQLDNANKVIEVLTPVEEIKRIFQQILHQSQLSSL